MAQKTDKAAVRSELASIEDALRSVADTERREVLMRFFKTGKGEYAEGDAFLGVSVPLVRSMVRHCEDASESLLHAMLLSRWHEPRLLALLVMVHRMERLARRTDTAAEEARERVVQLYLAHTHRVNNWDLVDLSAYKILGEYLVGKSPAVLFSLAHSGSLWEQRIAIVSTFAFIRRGDCTATWKLAALLLHHEHDLMHKAVGWMLREAGKRRPEELEHFLEQYGSSMPRTMLRYAIERLPAAERKEWLERTRKPHAAAN